jgi:tetratricopeptide (TPR) repeat protein
VSRPAARHVRLGILAGLVLLTAAAYEGVRRCDFVAFDDDLYVYRHPYVAQGLTPEGVRFALSADLLFESPHADYWMPVTVLSRMADVELFGLDPAGHHLVNAALHAAAALLVFVMLEGLTGARGRSAFAAALFAVHPLTVESVAWVTERKDVLAALFWMGTVIAWTRYARGGGRGAYAAALGIMTLGLMSKPTLVTLPLVLLALDVWPLRRLVPGRVTRSIGEKAPFFLLAGASAAATLLAHARGGHLATAEALPLGLRLANALWSLVLYPWMVLRPVGLAVPYPYDRQGLAWRAALAAALLALAAIVVFRSLRSRPYLFTGAAWYVLALLPVLGIVQTGPQGHADRFMYIPLVGVGIVLAWGAAEVAGASTVARRALPWAVAALLLSWVMLTRAQVATWKDTVTLFTHAVAVTDDNAIAHHNLATALALKGDLDGAEQHYREAVRILPGYAAARSALGVALARRDRLPEALEHQREAVRLAPGSADAHFNLGLLWARLGKPAEAAARYAEALRLDPGLAAAHYSWGNLLAAAGRWREAEGHYREAVRLEPADLDAANNLALSIGLQGHWEQAAVELRQVIARDPRQARARVNLGRALRELGRAEEARAEWRAVLEHHPDDPAAAEARDELARLDSIRAAR